MNYVNVIRQSVFFALAVTALAGCHPHTGADDQNQPHPASAPPPLSHGANATSQTRYVPIKPDMISAEKFDYKVYEFANDGSWISIVPMPPKAGDIEISVEKPGNYVAKLTNEKCAYPVVVAPTTGAPFTLTAKDPTHAFVADAGLHLEITMGDNAVNNYFCNVAVAVAP